ncbi:MAG: hypothetical protein RMK20_11775, partial [Verrucomicrobiales bacterium]|nr:hypothetical protein [Verrucomicrobiales bacterium]
QLSLETAVAARWHSSATDGTRIQHGSFLKNRVYPPGKQRFVCNELPSVSFRVASLAQVPRSG